MASFLHGGGEMGELTRSYNWNESSLGQESLWSPSLKSTLNLLLNTRFPMVLYWGPEHLVFYNDAFRPSLGENGKHPWALGKPSSVVWAEAYDIVQPFIDLAYSGCETARHDDMLIPILRNGRLEDVYWTFSFSS